MLIENPESLKAWLTTVIEPLCDADPSALAKYVIALIKKDKAVSELRVSMEEQMDVFLQGETKNFTRQLFEALESKSYIPRSRSASPVESAKPAEAPEYPLSESARPGEEEEDRKQRSDEDRHRRRRNSPFRTSGTSNNNSNSSNSRRRRFRSRSPPYSSSSSSKRRRSPYNGRRSPRRSRDSLSPLPSSVAHKEEEDNNGYTPSSKKRPPRCRDYDEKGFCMRGDMCKYDHGVDAVVLEDNTPSNPTSVPPPPYLSVGGPPGPYVGSDPYVPVVPPSSGALVLPPLHVPPPGYAVPPSAENPRKRSFEGGAIPEGYPPHKRFDYNRLGHRGGGRGGHRGGVNGRNMANKLAVRNIPPLFNNIAQLNNHFARFGTLVNVQVQFEGDPGSALVTFAKHTEAEAAFSSSEAVMGNRFIKMFYYYDRPNYNNSSLLSVKDRLGIDKSKLTETAADGSLENGKAKDENGSSTAQKAEEKAAEIAAIQKNQELLKANAELKKKQEDKKKEAVKNLSELQRSKQSLLEKLIAQQKALIVKFEKSEDPEEKTEIMKLSKALSLQIENAREDVKKAMQATQVKKNPGELQKELLDAELELFNVQQNGNDTTELQKKVNALKIEAARVGVLPTSRLPRGRPGYYRGGRGYRMSPYGHSSYRGSRGGLARGRGRGYGVTSVDRRPSKILVSGFEPEEKDELIGQFQKFGEIIDTIVDDAVPSIVFHFKLRREAETAMNSGKSLGERVLQLSWYSNPSAEEFSGELDDKHHHVDEAVLEEEEDDYTPLDPAYIPPGLEENETSLSSDKDDKEKELNADDLLYDDPGDEDEEEERSWKR